MAGNQSLIGDGTILAIAAFVVVGLAAGHLLGGPDPEDRTVLALSTASRHPGVAMAIVSANFPGQKIVLAAALLYLIVNAVVSLPYLNWRKRQHAAIAGAVKSCKDGPRPAALKGGPIMTSTCKPSEGTRSTSAVAGVAGVEIKVTIRGDQELEGIRALELDEDSAEVRLIYFYDTPSLDLFNAGLVLRARLVKGDNDDSTVKIRPVEPAKVPQNWSEMPGFKIEADSTGDRIVCSASLTTVQKRDEIDDVAKGKRPIYKLYSPDQERFLSQFSPHPVDFAALRVLGPIRVLRWQTKHKRFAHELTCEEWRLPDGEDLLEVSIKVEPDQAATARRAFETHLRELGLDPAGAQETKTRTALERLSRTLKPAG